MRLLTVLSFLLFITNQAIGCGATISPNQKLCYIQGNTYTVTFTGTGGTAPYVFSYKINNGATQTITSDASGVVQVVGTMTAQGNYNYTITSVTDNAGCTQALNTSSSVFLQGTLTVQMTGNATVLQNYAPGPVITFNCLGGVPFIVFDYTINGGPVQTITSNNQGMAFLNAPTDVVGTFVYQLVGVHSSLSCPGMTNIVHGTVTITVNPAPSAPSATVSISGQCQYYTLTFNGSGGLTPNYTYTYTLNGVTYSQNGGASFSMNGPPVSTMTTYTLSGVSVTNNGNTGTLSGNSTATIFPYTNNTITTNTNSVCLNGPNPTVSFSRYNGSGYYTFNYSINSGPTQSVSNGGNFASISVPTNVAGSFTYMVFPSYQMCDLTIPTPVTIVVKPLPTASVSGSATVCSGSTNPNITFTGANGTGPYTFTYKLNGGSNQTISTTGSATSVTLPVSTTVPGTYVYTLVSVSSLAGCSQNQTGTATVVVNGLPSASISGDATVCQNASSSQVTFTGSGSIQPYTFLYSINGGTGQTLSSGSSNLVTINQSNAVAGTSNYQLISVTGGNGCVNNNQSGTVSIVVNEMPQASISGTAAVCQNSGMQQVQFSSPGTNAPYTFAYKINGGAVQTVNSGTSSTVSVDVSSSTSGIYTYDLINVTGANGCSNSQTGTAVVTVNPLPSVSISGDAAVCQNANDPAVVFSTTAVNGPFDIVFNLNGGAAQTINSGGNSDVSVDVSTAVAGTLVYNLVSISDSQGCSQLQTGSATVTINALPNATIAGSAEVCMNEAEPTVIFTGTNGNGAYDFTFNVNNGTNQVINSNGNASVILDVPSNESGDFEYNLISVMDGNGCSNNQTGTAVVTVNPLPNVSISGNATVCQNDNSPAVVFSTSTLNGPFDIAYTINGGSVQSTNSSTSLLLFVPTDVSGEFEYSLVSITDANGCSMESNETAIVTINPTPSAPTIFASGGNSICEGQSITLTSSGTDNLWSTGEISQSIEVSEAGDYSVEQVILGCSSELSAIYSLNVIEVVEPEFQLTTEYCVNSSIEDLPEMSMNGVEGSWSPQINQTQTTTYTFTPNIGICANSVNHTITIHSLPDVSLEPISMQCVYSPEFDLEQGAPVGGTYSVDGIVTTTFDPSQYDQGNYPITYSFTDINGCSNQATSIVVVDECLGLNDDGNIDLSVYPNPSSGVFHFIIPENVHCTISVFDSFGKNVHSQALNMVSSTVDLSHVANGVYTVRVTSDFGVSNKTIVKH